MHEQMLEFSSTIHYIRREEVCVALRLVMFGMEKQCVACAHFSSCMLLLQPLLQDFC
jgi:hypothetical protein